MSPPKPVRRAVFTNLLMAGAMVCLLASGYLHLEQGLALSWPVVAGFAIWLLGMSGVWWGRLIGYTLVFFHSTPSLRIFTDNPEIIAILGASLVPWTMVVMLFHPDVRRFVRQGRSAGW